MNARLRLAACLCLFAVPAAPLSAQIAVPDDAVRLSPSTPWNLEYAEEGCVARRLFGEVGQQTYFALHRYSPKDGLRLTIASDDLDRRIRRIGVTFLPNTVRDWEHDGAYRITVDEWGEGILANVTLLDEIQQQLASNRETRGDPRLSDEAVHAREAEVDGVLVEGVFRDPVYLSTGSLGPIMGAMRTCLDDLVESWGIDMEVQQTLSRPVVPKDARRWTRIISENYPRTELSRGQQAYVRARMIVSEEGLPTSCVVQNLMNDESFNILACELLMKNARFEPALDANGVPVRSYWTTAIRYQIQ